MPLEQRVIAPIYVSRGCFDLNHGLNHQIIASNVPNELECVTNGTLANIIRQLSSLSRYAEDLFGSLLDETATLVSRSVGLKTRLDALGDRVENLDASNDPGSLLSAPNGTINRKPFRSRTDNFDQQVVARTTMPLSLGEVYESSDQPPPLDKLNPFRDDGLNGLKFYTNPNYFFELWSKEMLASDRSRNKVAKKGDNVHMSGGKTKRNKQGSSALRHQTSINSDQPNNSISTASPSSHYHHHYQQQQQHSQQQIHSRSSISSADGGHYGAHGGSIYGENGMVIQPAQTTSYAQPQQQKIYGQTTGHQTSIYAYGTNHPDMNSMVKRDETNPSVIEGFTVDRNNYQHHFVHSINDPHKQGQSRPNSLELSQQQAHDQYYHQQQQAHYMGQQQPSQPANPGDYYQQHGYQRTSYGSSGGGNTIYGTQQQQQYSPSSNLTPTRRAAAQALSRPSAPPPAPPGSGPNSAPSTPKKMNGGQQQDMMVTVSGHPQLVSRDSLPPPPPPPTGSTTMSNGASMMNSNLQHHEQETALPPPPPPSPPPMTSGASSHAVCSPPPPPPPPVNGLFSNATQPKSNGQPLSSMSAPNTAATTPLAGTANPTPTAEMLQSVKLRPTQPNGSSSSNNNGGKVVDARTNLLAAIRHGIKLKRVEESGARETEKTAPLHDVASILARRVALQMSDSEGEASDDGDESDAWDDESE
ncbi:Wiskott-Aldrich syndrome protein member 1, partial [Blomia tropicalis]